MVVYNFYYNQLCLFCTGVQNVDIDVESGEVTVKGIFDPKKMYDIIEKKSKRKVDWISPKPKEEVKEEKIQKIQKKEAIKFSF